MNAMPTPSLTTGTVDEARQRIRDFFLDSFDTYESLFSQLVSDEAFYQKPESLRHPLIFYYGHTATFFINKLVLAKLLDVRINPRFESLFAIGVDEMSWDDLNDANYDWPQVSEVRDYRVLVRQQVLSLIDEIDFTLPIDWKSPMWPVVMGIEHERIHLETSSVLMRQLNVSYIKPAEEWPVCETTGEAPDNKLINVPQGAVSRRKQDGNDYYGWDNEYGRHDSQVNAFAAAKFLVSNGEYLRFVQDGGYRNDSLWEEEGLRWRDFTQAAHPVFWVRNEGGALCYRAMNKMIPLPLNWPVDVNYHEAKAFCNWLSLKEGKSLRLPTEDEYFRLQQEAGIADGPVTVKANIGLRQYASSVPVDTHAHGKWYDVVGNVWQWTETPIYPFPGFRVHPLYDDFTTPTFDNKHNLIKGGSWISTGNEANTDSRYAFRRHFFQHAGFRYVESEDHIVVTDFDYESDTQVSQYCEFHYGDSYFDVPNFARRCAEIAVSFCDEEKRGRALDLGCAVGRASFELAKYFDHVDGIDFSARFISTAFTMQERGEIRYAMVEEGELRQFCVRRLTDFADVQTAQKVSFSQGDACNLKSQFTGYDLIFLGNLLDRVYSPRKLLDTVAERLNEGGVLVIASPFTWLEEYTERSEWLGGFKDENGESRTTTDALDDILPPAFTRMKAPFDVPFVIRETRRKYQHTLSQFNVFKKR